MLVNSNSFYYKLAKWYLLLMPIRQILPFHWLRDLLPGGAIYFDCILHALGILILLGTNKKYIIDEPSESLLSFFRKIVIWFTFSSIIMSIVMYIRFGERQYDSPFSAILGMIIYFAQYVLILYYNKNIFPLFKLSQLTNICEKICLYLLCLGYIQIAARMLPPLGIIYDNIDVLQCLPDMEMLNVKLALTTTEGAAAGVLIGTFVLPFLFSRFICSNFDYKYIRLIVLWLPIVYYTTSTTCFLLTAIDFAFVFFLFRKHVQGLIIPAFVVILMMYVGISNLSTDASTELSYLIFSKLSDSDNASSVSRMAPLYMDWEAFINNPIIGCGNGLQGYYDYAIPFVGNSYFLEEVMDANAGKISNGGVFWPSVLSGYGIVGFILFAIFLKRSYSLITAKKLQLGEFYYMYLLSMPALLFAGMQGDFYGNYFIWFIFSIPLMSPSQD